MFDSLKQGWRRGLDVRPSEYGRTAYLFCYLLFVLLAYYILKPVSRALFLNQFDASRLPWLYLLTALVGGILAYFYGRLAVRVSLRIAVAVSTGFVLLCLALIWLLLSPDRPWMYYTLNVWVSLFSLVLVSQGWLIAGEVFAPREAKRVYGILAAGSVLGAAIGGSLTAAIVPYTGTNNLIPVSAVFVVLAYACFAALSRLPSVDLTDSRATREPSADVPLGELVSATFHDRHLQVIVGILALTYLVDTLVDFQFNVMASAAFRGDALTAFLGGFYGLTLNVVTFVLQVFLTTWVVRRFGVGGTLLIMPLGIGVGSLAMLVAPGVMAAGILRLVEASTRYSFNRTGMELLYLPLNAGLKERTKAFLDVFVDRAARGLGALLLLAISAVSSDVRVVAVVVLLCCAAWIALSVYARREYAGSVKRRLEARRLDVESLRTPVDDPGVLALLEETALSGSPRQAQYAISTLAGAPRYPLARLMASLARHQDPAIRALAFENAARLSISGLDDDAEREVQSRAALQAASAASVYLITRSPRPAETLQRLDTGGDVQLAETAVAALESAGVLFDSAGACDLLRTSSGHQNPAERRLAALFARFAGPTADAYLPRMFRDADPGVQRAAVRSASRLRSPNLVEPLMGCLAYRNLRREVRSALAAHGNTILRPLRDFASDPSQSGSLRRQALRAMAEIGTQGAANEMLSFLESPDLSIRSTALRLLQRMRKRHPSLNFATGLWSRQILAEVRSYYEQADTLTALKAASPQSPAVSLLRRTLESRAEQTIQHLFGMLGLKYPPKEIDAAFRAVRRGGSENIANAAEFLDNVLEHDLKGSLLPLLDDLGAGLPAPRSSPPVPGSLAAALRILIRSGDSWLTACSMTAVADLGLMTLAPDVASAASPTRPDIHTVAQSALARLR